MANRLIIPFGPVMGWLLVALGVLCLLLANRSFRRAGTTISPINPHRASQLVTEGIFAVSRNPMYLGLTLILLGAGLLFCSWLSISLPLFFMLYITQFQIKPEEIILAQKFGRDYYHYRRRVRRWL
ncbi:MAG: isoprenylcysteine carboxylmethyltransferase family protein [Alphaproteobacteria bacterium]|nr:isoprenylcysteine carboxylmethyltransferase family protein [Alphaproteobacteria bacterium]